MPNLVELAQWLKGAPDAALAKEALAPTGTIPPFLVQAEISRRNSMRESAASAKKSPGTVLEDSARALLAGPQAGQAPPVGPTPGGGAAVRAAPSPAQGGMPFPGSFPAGAPVVPGAMQGMMPPGPPVRMADGGLVPTMTGAPSGILSGLPVWRWPGIEKRLTQSSPAVDPRMSRPPMQSPQLPAMAMNTGIGPIRMFAGGAVPKTKKTKQEEEEEARQAAVVRSMPQPPRFLMPPPPGPFAPPVVTVNPPNTADADIKKALQYGQMPPEAVEAQEAMVRKQAQQMLGQQDLSKINAEIDRYRQQLEKIKPNAGMTMLQLGLGMAAGSSPYALQNVAAGGQAALEGWQKQQDAYRQGIGALAGLETTAENLKNQYRQQQISAADPIRSGINWRSNTALNAATEILRNQADIFSRADSYNAEARNRAAIEAFRVAAEIGRRTGENPDDIVFNELKNKYGSAEEAWKRMLEMKAHYDAQVRRSTMREQEDYEAKKTADAGRRMWQSTVSTIMREINKPVSIGEDQKARDARAIETMRAHIEQRAPHLLPEFDKRAKKSVEHAKAFFTSDFSNFVYSTFDPEYRGYYAPSVVGEKKGQTAQVQTPEEAEKTKPPVTQKPPAMITLKPPSASGSIFGR